MNRLLCAAFAVICALASPVSAGPTAADLSRALNLEEVTDILHDEGMDYAGTIETDMLPGGGGQLWDQTIGSLYDRDNLRIGLERALERDMSGDGIAEAVAFFDTEDGQTILDLENAARRAMADPLVEDAARATTKNVSPASITPLSASSMPLAMISTPMLFNA